MKNLLPSDTRLNAATDVSGATHILAVSFEASSAERQIEIKPDMKANLSSNLTHRPARLGSSFVPRRPVVAPSLRLRAVAANRSLLRWMRAAELAAWQDANASAGSIGN